MRRLLRLMPPQIRHVLRRLSRLRWVTKAQILRRYDVRLREQPRRYLTYLLLDPEVESYTYDLANEDELCAFAARVFETTAEQAAGYVAETKRDPELNARLQRRIRWRFDLKRRLPLGNRLMWYVLVRARKPALVVETGIHEGLGSLVLLRALERNAEEGHQGELMSVEVDPTAGFIVAPELRGRWRRVTGLTSDALAPALEGRTVDVLIHDTPHTEHIQRHEFGVALAHAGDPLIIVDSSGGQVPVLEQLCADLGVTRHYFRELPRDHFWPTSGSGIAVIPRAAAQRWDGRWPAGSAPVARHD